MIKHLFGAILILSSLLSKSQTFSRKDGDVVGYQTVMSMPIGPSTWPMIQGLIYYPDDYFLAKNANKRYPVFVFLHGAGESKNPNTTVQDIGYMNKAGLPLWLSKGNKPYGIDPITKDTIKWIIVSPHCTDNPNCSYSYPQLIYTVPYVFSKLRVDSSCIWVGGLSGGGSGTWSCVMGDSITSFGKLFTGIMPESNGGWDENIKVDKYKQSLISNLKNGLAILAISGELDQGYNDLGFKQYRNIALTYGQSGRYLDSIPKGLGHVPAVWDQPWPLTARVWSKTMNSWAQMWSLRNKSASPPVVTPPIVVPPIVPPYPIRIIIKYSDSSCSTIWQK